MHQQSSASPPEPSDSLEPAAATAADVSGTSLFELVHDPESELAESMRKLVAELHERPETTSSWGNGML